MVKTVIFILGIFYHNKKNLRENCAKDLNRHFTTEVAQMNNKLMKKIKKMLSLSSSIKNVFRGF